MNWIFSEETLFNLAVWQVVLGIGFTLSLGLILWRYRNLAPASRYHVWASAFFTIALLPWLALWPANQPTTTTKKAAQPHETYFASNQPLPVSYETDIVPAIQVGSPGQVGNHQTAIAANTHVVAVSTSPRTPQVQKAVYPPVPFNLEATTASSANPLPNWDWQRGGLLLFVGLWAMVSLFLIVKLGFGLWQLHRLKRDSEPIHGPMATWFNQTLGQMGLSRRPVLKMHETIASPLVAGLFQPAVLVPETLYRQLSGEALRQILLHELAHIKRWDDWVHLFQKAVLALFWFNPALQWLSRKMAWDRETACDQFAIGLTGKSKQYAYSLLKVSESMRHPTSGLLTVGAVRGKKQLTHRIESLLRPSQSPSRLSAAMKLFLGLLFTGCLASMAVAGPKLIMLQGPEDIPAGEKQALEKALQVEIEQLKRERDALLLQVKTIQSQLDSETRHDFANATDEERAALEEQRRVLEEMQAKLQSEQLNLNGLTTIERSKLRSEQERILAMERAVEVESQKMRQEAERNREQLELARRRAEELRDSGDTAMRERTRGMERHRRQLEAERAEMERQRAQLLDSAEAEARALEELRASQASAEAHALSGRYQHTSTSVSGKGNHIIFESEKGHSTMIHQTDEFELELRGKVSFNRDETGVATIGKGGSFKIHDQRINGQDHKLTVRPGRNGELTYTYHFNGRKREFDAEAQAWLANALPEILLESAINAEARVSRVLAEKGVKGVLDLSDRVESDFAKATYLKILVSKEQLSLKEIKRVVKASSMISSDFHRAQILSAVVTGREPNAELAEIMVDGMKGMGSDFEKRRVLNQVVPITKDGKAMAKLLKVVQTIGSDFEKRQILQQVASSWPSGDLAKLGFFDALGEVHSDFEFRQIVVNMTIDSSLSRDQISQLASLSAQRVGSDFELAGILEHLAEYLPLDAEFEKTIRSIHSDHEKGRLLQKLIERGDLDASEQETILNCTATIHSDHTQATVLDAFRGQYDLTGSIATRYADLVSNLSSHYRDRLSDH